MGISFLRSERLNRLVLRPNEEIYAGPAITGPEPLATAEMTAGSAKAGISQSAAQVTQQELLVAPPGLPD